MNIITTPAPAAADDSTMEQLRWHPAKPGSLPDADQSVLLWVRWPDGEEDWCTGWLDADGWRLCESGGLCGGEVTHWADVGGPA